MKMMTQNACIELYERKGDKANSFMERIAAHSLLMEVNDECAMKAIAVYFDHFFQRNIFESLLHNVLILHKVLIDIKVETVSIYHV
jgi:hypothetical protein